MMILKDMSQVRTMRQVKSYRSCPTSTGLPMWGAELGRICQEEAARRQRERRRRWLEGLWRHRGRSSRLGLRQLRP
jgi:hypothetical protein